MDEIIKEELTKYIDEKMVEPVDRHELQNIVEKVIIKLLLQIRTDGKDEEEL